MKYELTEIRREVTFRLEGADPVQLEYGQVVFRPELATVTTVGGVFQRAEVTGARVLKSGARGQTTHSQSWWKSARTIPDWVEDLIKAAEAVR